jgi:hypothetical protein
MLRGQHGPRGRFALAELAAKLIGDTKVAPTLRHSIPHLRVEVESQPRPTRATTALVPQYLVIQHLVSDQDPSRPPAVDWETYSEWASAEWKRLLEHTKDEKPVQQFLEQHPSFLPGSVDNVGPGGHHGAWWDAVVSQPHLLGLGPKRQPDFMWIRRDTEATRPILIEIERPTKTWFTQSLQPTAHLTQALDQLNEWRDWFSRDDNVAIFRNLYVPARFRHRIVNPQYVLVYGRSSEFRRGGGHQAYERARRKRDLIGLSPDLHLYTFDMLHPRYEAQDCGTLRIRSEGFEAVGIPPTFHTGSLLVQEGSLLDAVDSIETAVAVTPLISEERRQYILNRWNYWLHEKKQYDARTEMIALAGGFE